MRLPQVLLVGRVDRTVELRAELDAPGAQVRDKTRRDRGAVGVFDAGADRKVAASARVDRKQRQPRSKQEVADRVFLIPAADFREDGKGRVVDYDAAGRIVGALVIRAGIKGPHDRRALQIVVLKRPVAHGAVNIVRRIYVVGRQLLLEFFDEGFVFLRALLLDLSPKGEILGALLLAQPEPVRVVARDPHVESGGGQRLHFPVQDRLVRGGLSQQVIGVDKRAPLQLAQALDLDARKLRVPALPGRQDPPVAVDQVPLGVDPGRHDPAELVEAVDQAVDLLLRVQLRVPGIGDQLVDLPPYQADRLPPVMGKAAGHSVRRCGVPLPGLRFSFRHFFLPPFFQSPAWPAAPGGYAEREAARIAALRPGEAVAVKLTFAYRGPSVRASPSRLASAARASAPGSFSVHFSRRPLKSSTIPG